MPRSFIFIVLLVFYSLSGLGQNPHLIDSINAEAYKIRSTNRDSSKWLAYQALALSTRLNYDKGVSLASLNLGIYYCNSDILDSASLYLGEAYDYLLKSTENHALAINIWYKAKLFQKLGDFNKAFQYLAIAEEMFRQQKNDLYSIYVLTEQGAYHEMQDNYPIALEFYLKAYKFKSLHKKESEVLMRSTNNIASVYAKMNMLSEALAYAKIGLKSAKKWQRSSGIGEQLLRIGEIFQSLENYDSAIIYLNKSYVIAQKSKRYAGQALILAKIAEVYYEIGKYQRANNYLLKAKHMGNGISLLSIYLQLSKNYERQALKDSSLFYLHKTQKLASKRGSIKYLLVSSEMLITS